MESLESGKWKKKNIEKAGHESGLCNISYARFSEKRFTQIYKALYGDTMFVSLSGAEIRLPETNKNICFWVVLLMPEFLAWRTHNN